MTDRPKHAATSSDPETRLSVILPSSIVRAARMYAAEHGMTLRATVLSALQALGIKVPPGAIADRRAEANRQKGKARRAR